MEKELIDEKAEEMIDTIEGKKKEMIRISVEEFRLYQDNVELRTENSILRKIIKQKLDIDIEKRFNLFTNDSDDENRL
jgi:CRISPR/Cas system-associated endonuclease Cas3-HD